MTLLFQILMLIAFSYVLGIILHELSHTYRGTLILDYSVWRCGLRGPHQLGRGDTKLLNYENYMCCLGQISIQLNKNIPKKLLLDREYPHAVEEFHIPLLKKKNKNISSEFSMKAIIINDCKTTTPQEKIERLRGLFSQYGYALKVINMPK